MQTRLRHFLMFSGLSLALCVCANCAPQSGGDFADNPQPKKLPSDVILEKGGWSSASDSVTPVPESGTVTNDAYNSKYFGLTYSLPAGWMEKYSSPPPSDSGYYTLAQFRPQDRFKGTIRGSILVTAQDLFFSLGPTANALELINYSKDNLSPDYKVEQLPTLVRAADHSFVRFDYFSPVAELHWRVLATQIRCHMIQFIFASHDTELTESLIKQMNTMVLPDGAGPISGFGGGDVPVCIKDYAASENVIERVDPVFSERKFNPVPVRIIIDKQGKVKHIHFLSAFPDQAKSISDALSQWRFKPLLRDGQAVEVETGIMFGHAPRSATFKTTKAATE